MENSLRTLPSGGKRSVVQYILVIFVLIFSSRIHASVSGKNADYSMFDYQFNRVGDTKLDNEVTDCALVQHQFQKGYIRLREYLERIEGCGREGKMKNVEGIAESTVEDLRKETIAEIAKATTEDFHYDPPISAPVAAPVATPLAAPVATPLAAPVATPLAVPVAAPVATPLAAPVATPLAAPVATPPAAPVARTIPAQAMRQAPVLVRQKPMQQTGMQRNQPARPPGTASQQSRPQSLGTPYKKNSVLQFHKNPSRYNSFQTINKALQQARAFAAPDPWPRFPAPKPLQRSPLASAQGFYKSLIKNQPGLPVTVGKPLYRTAASSYTQSQGLAKPNQSVQYTTPLNRLAAVGKSQPSNLVEAQKKVSGKTSEEDENGPMDNNLDDSSDTQDPDKDIDDVGNSRMSHALDKEPSDMPMPGIDEDTMDEGIQSVDTDGSDRGGLDQSKQKTAGMKPNARIQNPANRLVSPKANGPLGVQVGQNGGLSQVKASAGLKGIANAHAYVNRGNPASMQAGAIGQIRRPAVHLNLNKVLVGTAKVQVNPNAPFRNAANIQGPRQTLNKVNTMTASNHESINLDTLKNKIMHTTNATYLRRMLSLIRKITHHRDFQKLHGPARAFVSQANTAVQALNKAYSQRVVSPALNQPNQPQYRARVVKKFQIARNPYYAQKYYPAQYRPPYYALQRMQYGWYNGNTP